MKETIKPRETSYFEEVAEALSGLKTAEEMARIDREIITKRLEAAQEGLLRPIREAVEKIIGSNSGLLTVYPPSRLSDFLGQDMGNYIYDQPGGEWAIIIMTPECYIDIPVRSGELTGESIPILDPRFLLIREQQLLNLIRILDDYLKDPSSSDLVFSTGEGPESFRLTPKTPIETAA